MESALTTAALLAITVAACVALRARTALKSTTLIVAWRWAMGSLPLWLIATLYSRTTPQTSGLEDMLWYSVALLSLCPAIAVLGARRPGAAAWTWFVLLPMLAVLGWPMLTMWGQNIESGRFQLELPQLIGFTLVLVMGAGNYVGTRFWMSACLYAVAICLIVAPISTVAPSNLSPQLSRTLGSLAMGIAAVMPIFFSQQDDAIPSLDRVWNDFRDSFGIVWSRRLQERICSVALQQEWPVQITLLGIFWDESLSGAARKETEVKLEQSLRWHLRRYVDPEWIDERLTNPPQTDI